MKKKKILLSFTKKENMVKIIKNHSKINFTILNINNHFASYVYEGSTLSVENNRITFGHCFFTGNRDKQSVSKCLR